MELITCYECRQSFEPEYDMDDVCPECQPRTAPKSPTRTPASYPTNRTRLSLFGYSIPTSRADPTPATRYTTAFDLPITEADLAPWPKTRDFRDFFPDTYIDLPVMEHEAPVLCGTCDKHTKYTMQDTCLPTRQYCMGCYILFDFPK